MKRLLLMAALALALPTAGWVVYHTATGSVQPVGETVYVTKTGEKYHRGNCGYLAKSKRAMDLADAQAAGYTPCSRCKPPR